MARTLKWKQKAHNGGLGSEKTSNLVSAAFLSEGEKLLGGKLHSPSLFKPLRAGGAHPGELTLHFFSFFLVKVRALYGSAFAYSKPLG